ncbi:MAG: hypothetical protein RR824_06350 [Clostridia bacterium]
MTEHECLRALAGEVAQIAHLPIQKETAKLYRAVNSLHPIRPVVLVDELPWNQLNTAGELTLQCENPFFREVELDLRKTLYKWKHCAGDLLVMPHYPLSRVISEGDMGVQIREDTLSVDQGNSIVSHQYRDQLPDVEALEKLHIPKLLVDDVQTQNRYQQLEQCFGDLLPIRLTGLRYSGIFAPWDELCMWRGVEPLLLDLMDEPEKLHAFMRKFTDIRLALLKQEEELGLLDTYMPTLCATAGLADDLPAEPQGRVTRKQIWGRGAAQILASVSPAMHDEFDIAYQQEFFEGFGLVYYGCCEPLDRKIDIIRKIPNLRKISISPWADVRVSAEQIGRDYVLSRKPNPASVAVTQLDDEAIRKDILETLDSCRQNHTTCEFILKDISTVCHHPEHLTHWSQIVKETILQHT